MDAPTILKKLLEPYPPDVRAQCWEAVEKLHIRNPDDPIFELMLALGLWGTYYQKISGEIVEAGRQSGAQNDAALKSLDERVRLLQGLAQIIQQATDRLSGAGAEIVKNFPVEQIAEKITARLDETINTLPIKELEGAVVSARLEMDNAARSAKGTVERLDAATKQMEDAARRINQTNLPRLSAGWIVLWLVTGAAIAGFGISLFTSRTMPEMKRVAPWVKPDPAGAVITIPGSAYQSATQDKESREITIQLKP